MQAHDWLGNVRELEHAIQRAVIVCRGTAIQVGDLPLGAGSVAESLGDEPLTLEAFERRYICQILEWVEWVISGPRGAAVILGMKDSTLRARMRKLKIKRP